MIFGRFARKANKSAMPEIRPWPLPSNCADKLRGSLIKRPVTDVMASTHKPPADCESHIQQSQLSAGEAGRQTGRQAAPSLSVHLATHLPHPPPHPCIYLYVSFYFVSPPARDPGVTRAEYLSGLSKNDLEGRGQSIFSDSDCALTIQGTRGSGRHCTLLCCGVTTRAFFFSARTLLKLIYLLLF